MAEELFTVAGITSHGDKTKVRVTNDMARRIKQFTKGNASRIDFVELPNPMTKVEAFQFLQTHEMFQSSDDQAVIADAIADRSKETKKREVKVRKPRAKVAPKPSVEGIIEALQSRARKQLAEVTEEKVAQEIVDTVSNEPVTE